MKRLTLNYFVFLLISLTTMGQKYSEAEAILDKLIEKGKTPGLQYVAIKNNEIIYEYYGGIGNYKNNEKVDKNTVFKIFSTTKTFTALAIMQLAEQKKLNIKDPVSKYVDYYPYKEEITIKQVLSHTAGIPNPPVFWVHYKDDHSTYNYKKFRKEIFTKFPELKRKPGKRRSYDNIGFLYLAEIIESLSGLSYIEYINTNIIEKLDIPEQYLSYDIPENNYAYGHIAKKSLMSWFLFKYLEKSKIIDSTYGKWHEFTKHYYLNGAAYGGLHANARSLAWYGNKILNYNPELLNKDSYNLMFAPVKLSNDKEIPQYLAWMKKYLKNETVILHPGGGGGYSCLFRIYPNQKMVTVLLINRTQTFKDLKLLDKIDYYFFK